MSDAQLMKEALKVAKHKGDVIIIPTQFPPSTLFQLQILFLSITQHRPLAKQESEEKVMSHGCINIPKECTSQ